MGDVMNVYGYLQVPMGAKCLWVSMSVCMCDYGYMSVDGCLWVSLSIMGVWVFIGVSRHFMGAQVPYPYP